VRVRTARNRLKQGCGLRRLSNGSSEGSYVKAPYGVSSATHIGSPLAFRGIPLTEYSVEGMILTA
jgi:hypothetical protein